MTNKELTELYQEIKHKGKKLSVPELQAILRILEKTDSYMNEGFASGILCIALGSNYFESNPNFFKRFFSLDLHDADKGEVFKAISYSDIASEYLDEIFYSISLKKYVDPNRSSSCFWAIIALSGYIYKSKDSSRYRFLYEEYMKSEDILSITLDEDDKEDIIDYMERCYKALLYSLYGKKSSKIFFNIEEKISTKMDLPKDLSAYE